MKKKKIKKIKKEEIEEKKTKKIINLILGVVLAVLVLVFVDLFCIIKLNVGPFLAIRTSVLEDGGSKIYYGLGYKVIKYNQTGGKHGTKVGFYTMPYSTTATEITMLDLALEYGNDARKTYRKYYDQYLKVTGVIESVDNQNKVIVLRYSDNDEKGKYTLDVVVNTDLSDVSVYSKGQVISFRGSLIDYKEKDKDNAVNQLIFRNGYID